MERGMVAAVGKRRVEGDYVGVAGEFVEGVPVGAAFGLLAGRVAEHDLHADGAGPAFDNRADMSDADDSDAVLAQGAVDDAHQR